MKPIHFLVVGGQLHGNLGAAGMSIVTIRQLHRAFPGCDVSFVAKYHEGERSNVSRFLGTADAVRLVPTSQLRATFLDLPLSAVARLFRAGAAAGRLSGLLRSHRECDVVVDIGGVTFSEDRGLEGLLINATWVLLAALAGKPMVKLSQAFGPLRRRWFRTVSRALLRRVAMCIARGELSAKELRSLGLGRRVELCADLAFLLGAEESAATQAIERPESGLVIGVAPSAALCGKMGGEAYTDLMARVIERLLEEHEGSSVWIVAHAYREERTLRNNDGPVCRAIHAALPDEARARTRLIAGRYTPGEMRTIIGRTDALLACRFHAMVSALAMGVPVGVIGWSHKYREMLEQFGLDSALAWRSASVEAVGELMGDVVARRRVLGDRIRARLPVVVASAARNFELLAAFVDGPAAAREGTP